MRPMTGLALDMTDMLKPALNWLFVYILTATVKIMVIL